MKKYYFMILITLFLQGCNKNDSQIAGKGEICLDGHVYQLKNAYHRIFEEGWITIDHSIYYSYLHVLTFTGDNWGTRVNALFRTENNEISSGEFHVGLVTTSNEYNSIQMKINLADDFVHFADNFNPSKRKLHLSHTKKDNDIFEIELEYVDDESDFSVKWIGTVKDECK